MRNVWRVAAFDVAAPIAAIAALVYIGVALAWPLWWVSVCSILCLLIVEGVVVNVVLARRDGVTLGTDDDAPGLRLAVAAVATAAVVAGVAVGYLRWTVPDHPAQRHRRGGGHRDQHRRSLGDVHPAEPDRVDRPRGGHDVGSERRSAQEPIRHGRKGIDQ